MSPSSTAMRLHGLARSNAILQAGRPVLFRGTGTPGATVRVTIESHTAQTLVEADGRWKLHLPAMPAGGPHRGTVTSADEVIAIEDLYFGEVWLCAGQSNMAMSVAGLAPEEVTPPGSDELVRFVLTPARVSAYELDHTEVEWLPADRSPKTASAVGLAFAAALRKKLRVPVGFVQSAMGHTPAMSWTPAHAIAPDSIAARLLADFRAQIQSHPNAAENLDAYRQLLLPGFNRWNKEITKWGPVARAAKAAGKTMPPMPIRETGFGDPHTPTVLFNSMIAPHRGEAFAGVLWYQGESDAILGFQNQYRQSLASLIDGFRSALGELPIVLVELPRHDDIQCNADENWPVVRMAQQQALADPRVGVVPAIDLGDTERIHPIRKEQLARRAADVALNLVYGHPGRRHGPIFGRAEFRAGKIELNILNVAGQLTDRAAPPFAPNIARFEIAIDGHWREVPFKLIAPDRIELPASASTTAVRYAWAGDPLPRIFDSTGLPLSPFIAQM